MGQINHLPQKKTIIKKPSLIRVKTSCRIYSILKQSQYTVVFLAASNESQCVPLLFLSWTFLTYAPSFILVKLSLAIS